MITWPHIQGPYKLEKEFQAALHKAFKRLGYFIYRIPDLGPAYRNFDATIFQHSGKVVCLEYKIIDGYTLNENKLEDVQHSSFVTLEGLGHECYVVVWSKKTNSYAALRYWDFMKMADGRGSVKLTNYLKF